MEADHHSGCNTLVRYINSIFQPFLLPSVGERQLSIFQQGNVRPHIEKQ